MSRLDQIQHNCAVMREQIKRLEEAHQHLVKAVTVTVTEVERIGVELNKLQEAKNHEAKLNENQKDS